MTLLAVWHVTTYRYKQPVSFGEHRIMFRPRNSYDQRLLDARIDIDPAPSAMRWIHDVFGNCVALARFTKEASELRFESNIRLDHQPLNAPDFQMEDYAQTYPFAYSAEEMPDLTRAWSGSISTRITRSIVGSRDSCIRDVQPPPVSS
jgi:transglutaminase-like putative cysteine protease